MTDKKKSLYEAFETNEAAESREGVILDYGDAGKIQIHRAGGANQKFKNYSRAKLAPHMRQINAGTLDEKVSRNLMIDVYARTVVIGWEGVSDRNGDELEFTRENFTQLMTDLPDLFDDIQAAAQNAALFRQSVQDDILGNSEQPSDGT